MSESVLVRDDLGDGVVALRLNRPQVLNALNVALLDALVTGFRDCAGARAVLLEAEGRAFCVGEDLRETLAPRSGEADELRLSFERLQEITRLATRLPCPVLAVVDGYAVGGGAELALAADLVIAGPNARFRFPEVTLGHAVTGGITARLPAIVGLLTAKELLLTGRWVTAEEAARLRLVNEVVPEPGPRARVLAAELAGHPERSVGATKRALEVASLPNQESALQHEIEAASWCFAAPDATDSIEAFRSRHADQAGTESRNAAHSTTATTEDSP